MHFNFTTELTERLKRLRTWLPGNMSRQRRAVGSLLKLNLPPLMGRRDAAYDCAVKLLSSPLTAAADKAAAAILFRYAVRDTEAIFWKLSNRDTELRERTLLSHISKLLNMASLLESFSTLGDQMNYEQQTDDRVFLTRPEPEEFNRSVADLCSCEEKIVWAMKRLCERVCPRVIRYRSYAAQNFSSANAERYRKAYDSYMMYYAGENPSTSSLFHPSASADKQL